MATHVERRPPAEVLVMNFHVVECEILSEYASRDQMERSIGGEDFLPRKLTRRNPYASSHADALLDLRPPEMFGALASLLVLNATRVVVLSAFEEHEGVRQN